MHRIHIVIGVYCWLASASLALAETPLVDSSALLERLKGDEAPLILDVRTEKEFATGHVPGAINVPVQSLPSELDRLRSSEDTSGREVVVYCERGGRAARAEALLRDAGFSNVLHLEGDMSEWRRAELPMAKPGADLDSPDSARRAD